MKRILVRNFVGAKQDAVRGGEPNQISGSDVLLFEKADWLPALFLIALTFLIYQPAWNGRAIWDDDAHLTSPALQSWHGLLRIWFEPGATQQYYPLVHTVFWCANKLWGTQPLGYHLLNITLHACSALLVMSILRRLTIPGAWLASLIFALHPVHVESVAWISELKNVLSGFFYLMAFRVYLNFDRNRDWQPYVAALLLFLAALLCKTVVATLPAALLVIFWWQRGRLSWTSDVRPLVPFFLLGTAAGIFTAWMERTSIIAGAAAIFQLTPIQRCIIAGRAVWFYLGKLLYPSNLTFIYPRWDLSQISPWSWLFPLSVLALLAAAGGIASRGLRAPLAGLLFFIGSLFPALGFIDVYPFVYSFVADHFQYLSSLGIISLVAAGIAIVVNRTIWTTLLPVIVIALLAGASFRQSAMYSDVEVLYRTTIDRNPGCFLAYNNLGVLLRAKGQLHEAIDNYVRCLQIQPTYAEAHNNLGNALVEIGRLTEAIDQYSDALKSRPNWPQCHYNLGIALLKQNRLEQAVFHLGKAVQLQPDFVEARLQLAVAVMQRGDIKAAITHFEAAVALRPQAATIRHNFGRALFQAGQSANAITQYQKSLELEPNNSDVRIDLGVALARDNRDADAIDQFQKALVLTPRSVEAHSNLGVILLRASRFDEAIEHFRSALDIRPGDPSAENNLARALFRLGRFQEAIPYYEELVRREPGDTHLRADLGVALVQSDKIDQGLAILQQVITLEPNHAEARRLLAVALAKAGRQDEAIAQFESALTIQPNNPTLEHALGKALLQVGRLRDAISHYQKALQFDPTLVVGLNDLAWLLATANDNSLRDGRQAEQLALHADQLTEGKDPMIRDTLAAAYAENGRFSEAIEAAQSALELAAASGNASLRISIQSHLKLYQARTRLRTTTTRNSN